MSPVYVSRSVRAARWRAIALVFAIAATSALASGPAYARPALDYRGILLTTRQVERLAAPVLDLPADSARVPEMLGAIVAELQGRGYLDARATADWDGEARERLIVRVAEGERYRIASLRIQAPVGPDSAALAAALPTKIGAWASPSEVARALEAALETVSEQGHPYATFGVRSWEADSGRVRLELAGSLGPLVTIHAVRFEGLKVTRASLAEKSMGRIKGLPYNRAAAVAARERLLELGLFRDVQLEGLEGEADWSRGQLVYRVEEPRYNRFEGALGMQGQAGAVGLMRLDLDNLLGTGRALGLLWESRGRGVTQLGARFAEPLVFGAPLRVEGSFDQNVQDTLYVRTRFGVRGRFAVSGTEHLEAGYEEERVVQDKTATAEARLRTTSVALERGTLDRPLSPRRGSRLRIGAGETRKTERLRPSGTASARAGNFEVTAEWHRPLGEGSGLAIEMQARGRFSSERVLAPL
jgi:outer membrane protein assembly factor BamA